MNLSEQSAYMKSSPYKNRQYQQHYINDSQQGQQYGQYQYDSHSLNRTPQNFNPVQQEYLKQQQVDQKNLQKMNDMSNDVFLSDQQQNQNQYYQQQPSPQKLHDITSDMQMLQQYGNIHQDDSQINSIIQNLRMKFENIENLLYQKESEKEGIIEDINILTQRLKALQNSINKKRQIYDNYDKTLDEAESAFGKITDSTRTLLAVVKKENNALSRATVNKEY